MKIKVKCPKCSNRFWVSVGNQLAAKGGAARAAKLSPERRQEIAKRAVEARWLKKKIK